MGDDEEGNEWPGLKHSPLEPGMTSRPRNSPDPVQNQDQQLLCWQRNGVVFPISVMSEVEAATALDKLREFEAALGHNVSGNSRFNSHMLLGWVWDIATSGAVLDHVEQILGPDIMLWSSDWVVKQAHTSGFFSFHQDGTYCGLRPASDMITVWIALTPSTEESGCVQFVLGSHVHGQLPHTETVGVPANGLTPENSSAQNNMLSRGQTIDEQHFAPGSCVVPAVLKPGEASIHSSFVVHASGPNHSDMDRVGLAF